MFLVAKLQLQALNVFQSSSRAKIQQEDFATAWHISSSKDTSKFQKVNSKRLRCSNRRQ